MATPAPSSRRFLAPGDLLGKHAVIRQIAVGGMAELYLTRTMGIEGFEKLVCVKRILPQYIRNRSFVTMFLNEARLAATLHHPKIAQVYDIGQGSDPPSTPVPSYPSALEAIVMRALARDPAQRWASALERQKELEDFAHDNRLRVSPLVLARLMSTPFPVRLEAWDRARARGGLRRAARGVHPDRERQGAGRCAARPDPAAARQRHRWWCRRRRDERGDVAGDRAVRARGDGFAGAVGRDIGSAAVAAGDGRRTIEYVGW